MAIKDQLEEQDDQPQEDTLSKEEKTDLRILLTLTKNLIDDEGHKIIESAEQSKDPSVVIGQFLMQLASQTLDQVPFEASPRILLAKDGWVEQISDYLQDEYNVPKKVMDRAEIFIASSAQQMAQGGNQPPQEGAPQPEQAQPVPQQQGPVMPATGGV